MNLLDTFAGIGGFSLAAHWAGMETVGFVEFAEFPQKVLAKNFPGIPIWGDVREFNKNTYDEYYQTRVQTSPPVNVISGGFPCQNVSVAGDGTGLNGESSSLWSEAARLLREFRPNFGIFENSSMLHNRGLEKILCDLA